MEAPQLATADRPTQAELRTLVDQADLRTLVDQADLRTLVDLPQVVQQVEEAQAESTLWTRIGFHFES